MEQEKKLFEGRPVNQVSLKEELSLLPKRLVALISKVISVKVGLILGLATWLVLESVISDWVWLLVVLIVVFGRDGLEAMTKFFSLKK